MGSQTSEATIINGNSLEELQQLPANSVDSVVTDPPYGLSFMGKKWDYDVPSKELWQEVFRVLKPGGHLLAFAGTRTQHRMAVNIEDAGFEIRDMIAWIYGSGFPKSLNISKALDKMVSDTPGVSSKKTDNAVGLNGATDQPLSWDNNEYGGGNAKCPICGKWFISGSPCVCPKEKVEFKSDKAKQWEGWGTSLKPALEPITVARKPIKGSVANNVLEWGTGGINIDGCRVGTEQLGGGTMPDLRDVGAMSKEATGIDKLSFGQNPRPAERKEQPTYTGRFPANFTHDGSDEVVGLFPKDKDNSAARFFYCAKASKSERNKGLENFEKRNVNDGRITSIDNAFQRGDTLRANTHPTVKPIKLMQYLVRLVTPKGGLVLDPFNGSGTTGIACKLEGFNYLGIELDPEYCAISTARIAAWEPEPAMHEQAVLL